MTYPGKTSPEDATRMGITEALDLRTTDEIEDDADARTDALREVLTGLPARPGVTR